MTAPALCPRCHARLLDERAACPGCLLRGDEEQETFAGVALHEELGRGGMGTVFKARHLTLGRDVAVKFLAPEVARDPAVLQRFRREAHALALLDHPGIVRVYDSGEHDGESYIVMEYVDGGPVSRHLPLSDEAAVRVTRQVCEALSYAHHRGVVHRDVKPENVLLTADGRVKVTDFGIARVLKGDGTSWTVTAPDVALGSAGFVAPEVLGGAPPDPRMDVYSTGALLRALLTGRPPVGEVSGLSPGLAGVVRRAMAERPADRYQTMEALQAALAGALGPQALADDERLWLYAVAFVQTAAVASVLWAGLLSLTPRILEKNDLLPLVAYGLQDLGHGQVLTRARFETTAVLVALLAGALGLGATALLVRHWRVEGLARPDPHPPIRAVRWVLGLGLFTVASYGLRLWAVDQGYVLGGAAPSWLSYLPFFGGLLEVVTLFVTLSCVLEARRRRRPLSAEPWLWVGQALALSAPVIEFFRTR